MLLTIHSVNYCAGHMQGGRVRRKSREEGDLVTNANDRGELSAPSRREPTAQLAAPSLTRHLGYLLRRAFVLSGDCARACITDDTTMREIALLALLAERAPLSQREAGEVLHVNRSVMVKLVDAMEAKGLVLRQRNLADRRSYALQLSDEGHRVHNELLAELSRGDDLLTARLSASERDGLNRALIELLDDPELVPIAALAKHSGYLIAQGHRMLRAHAIERLAPVGLDPRDFGALSVLGSRQPCSQNTLASQLGISPSGALGIVEDLENRGLVSRERSESDRRVYDVRLTAEGERKLAGARRAAASLECDVMAHLGERYEPLHRLLLQLVDPDQRS